MFGFLQAGQRRWRAKALAFLGFFAWGNPELFIIFFLFGNQNILSSLSCYEKPIDWFPYTPLGDWI
jgi:hypothetical protein